MPGAARILVRHKLDYLYFNATAGPQSDVNVWYDALARVGLQPQRPALISPSAVRELGRRDRLFIVGGDGTLNFLANVCATAGCVIAVLPGGTANDFARGLGIAADIDAACKALATSRETAIDIANVDAQSFLNVAHIGPGARVEAILEDGKKAALGRFSYIKTLLDNIDFQRGFRASIVCDGHLMRGRWLAISVANGNSFGGGYPVLDADPGDGLLDVVALRPKSILTLSVEWCRVHVLKLPPRHRVLRHLQGTEIAVVPDSKKRVSADGEQIGEAPATFTVRPGALRVLTPQQTTHRATPA